MLIMFISLLFSITLGNVLHAMDDENDEKEALEMCSNGEDSTIMLHDSSKPTDIRTLNEFELFVAEMVHEKLKTRSKKGINLPEVFETVIPSDVKISRQVFFQYSMKRNLIRQPARGLIQRVLCCRSRTNNPFKALSEETSEECKKKMFNLFYNQKIFDLLYNQRYKRTEVVKMDEFKMAGLTGLPVVLEIDSDKGFDSAEVDGDKDSDSAEVIVEVDSDKGSDFAEVTKKLTNNLAEAKLDKYLSNIIDEEQEDKSEVDEYKKFAYALFSSMCFLGIGLYVSGSCG